tara:strand:+ start:360 stop:542 length:183 start_codon:yes stop_codon:yes gene_type:complete
MINFLLSFPVLLVKKSTGPTLSNFIKINIIRKIGVRKIIAEKEKNKSFNLLNNKYIFIIH